MAAQDDPASLSALLAQHIRSLVTLNGAVCSRTT